jgi:hypothetical protein
VAGGAVTAARRVLAEPCMLTAQPRVPCALSCENPILHINTPTRVHFGPPPTLGSGLTVELSGVAMIAQNGCQPKRLRK